MPWSSARSARLRLLDLLRQAQLLGVELDATRYDRCIRFRLSFESELTEHSTETGPAPRSERQGTQTVRYSELLLTELDNQGKWGGSVKLDVTDEHQEKRWCTDETTPEWLCQTSTRELTAVGPDTAATAFVYLEQIGAPTLDLLFSRAGVDNTLKTTSCGSDGSCTTSDFTEHEVHWTSLAANDFAEWLAPDPSGGSFLTVRPPLTTGIDKWTWTLHTEADAPGTVETQDYVNDTTATLDFAGGE